MAALGGDVVLAVQPALVDLLRSLAPRVVALGQEPPDCMLHCPLMSLPHALRTTLATIPALTLTADPTRIAAWREKLGPPGLRPPGLRRIGLAVSGSPEHSEDALRSIPAEALSALFALPGLEWHLLQPDLREADRAALAPVRLHAEALTDFAETAALASLMDVVVTVDTSVAHLVGALGRPSWVLLPFAADWRWLRHRTDSPWYPTARLFRQTTPGDWATVVAAVEDALLESGAGRTL